MSSAQSIADAVAAVIAAELSDHIHGLPAELVEEAAHAAVRSLARDGWHITAQPRPRALYPVPSQEDSVDYTPAPTTTELQVLAGIARGHEQAQIADVLDRTLASVKNDLRRLRGSLGARNSAALVGIGYRRGWLTRLPVEPRTPVTLSLRMRQILEGLAAGRTHAEIAQHLCLSTETVKGHCRRLQDTLQARSVPHAIALGYQHGHLQALAPTTAAAA